MPASLTPTEADLWPFLLTCTNDVAGAARVLASMVRDHGDLGKISDSRLRRSALERCRIWQERVRADPDCAGAPFDQVLSGLELDRRALLWLEAGEGQGIVEISWVLQWEPARVRSELEALDTVLAAGRAETARRLRTVAAELPQDELFDRLDAARRLATSRERRRTFMVFLAFAIFVGVMLFVLNDLLNWQDARVIMPDPASPAPTQSSSS
ncbi:MAG: hypothetical protein ACIAQF_09650 [Phycisphaerales bacterium JB065]